MHVRIPESSEVIRPDISERFSALVGPGPYCGRSSDGIGQWERYHGALEFQ